MKKVIILVLVVIFSLPLPVFGYDTQDALDENYRLSRENERMINQSQRQQQLDNLRDAHKRQDSRDADFHRQELEQLNLRERMRGQ